MLFRLWTHLPYRPTRDIDFLAYGDHSVAHLETVFREVCDQAVEDDGLVCRAASVKGGIIKPDQEYQGVRIHLEATLERARIPVQIDLGFGDAITPGPQQFEYPSMLGFPTPIVSTYSRETVVAEKFQAMVTLGMANGRMKDFFDLWLLATSFEFDGDLVARAIQATFDRRRTPIPETIPLALTADFYEDAAKQTQWNAFKLKSRLVAPPPLPELISILQTFLMPPVESHRTGERFGQQWNPPGPWQA